MSRLQERFNNELRGQIMQKLGLKNRMEVPRITKITLNMGVGEGSRDAKMITRAEEDLALISGQKPKRTKARLSVAAFKLREGMAVGCCVTLRGRHMYDFLERLISIAIPRIRDFRGMRPKSFDGRGNYNFGIREHLIFLELDLSLKGI